MEREEQQKPDDAKASSGSTSIGLNLGFVKTPPGLLLVINVIILFLGWTVMAGWKDAVHPWWNDYYSGRSNFYLTATLLPWILFLVLFVLMMLNLHSRLSRIINLPVTLMINCVLWAILLFIASCVIADLIRKFDGACSALKCGHLGACTAFGFLGVIGLAIQAFFHFREWRSP